MSQVARRVPIKTSVTCITATASRLFYTYRLPCYYLPVLPHGEEQVAVIVILELDDWTTVCTQYDWSLIIPVRQYKE